MFFLILKIILACLLTAVPFIFRYWIRPKSKEQEKWHSMFSLLASKKPYFLRKKRIAICWILRIYRKMRFSYNARKFFTYIVIVIMLLVQVVDWQAASAAKEYLPEAAKGGETEVLFLFFHTSFLSYVLCLVVTLAAFSFRLSDCVLTAIHNSKKIQAIFIVLILVVLAASLGRMTLVAEILYVVLLAGMIYPNFSMEEKGRWYLRIMREYKRGLRKLRGNRKAA